jgi:predicted regulator of Ras-like GTPase activity (Roadblock/LC7/MglB family)
MDAAGALADLMEISSQVEAAAVFGAEGAVVASTAGDEAAARLARTGAALLEAAEPIGAAGRRVARLEVALAGGSVFVARRDGDTIVATTSRAPVSWLLFHDLETCLRTVAGAREQAASARGTSRAAREEAEAEGGRCVVG